MKNRLFSLLAAFAMAAFAHTANAGVINDTVHAQYVFPEIGSIYADMGTGVVGAGGVTFGGFELFNLTVTDNQVQVDFLASATWNDEPFNGFMLTDLTKALPAVTLDAATTMSGFGASNFYLNSGVLYVNWHGLSFDPSVHVVLDIGAADVPEPVTISLLGLGLLGLGASQRRRK